LTPFRKPTAGLRGPSTGPRTITKVLMRATLLTLAPSPTRSGPCDPAAKPGFLSWGCPKIAPPSYEATESVARVAGSKRARSVRAPFGMGTPVPIRGPPSWFLTTSAVSSSMTLRPFSGRCRSWGSPRFLPSRNGIPRDAPAALRSLPSADSDGSPLGFPWARVTASTVSGRCVHRGPCPLALRSLVRSEIAVSCGLCARAGASRPCSVVGSVARSTVSGRTYPVLPWAWPIHPCARRTAHTNKSALRQRPLREVGSSA
jgi:hypothetical protein